MKEEKPFLDHKLTLKSLADHLDIHPNYLSQLLNMASRLNGNWISTEEIELLNYNSNFGNWIDFVGIPGYYKFELDLSSKGPKNCQLKIPVMTPGGPWHFPLYHGRFDRKGNHVLIWQNEEVPVRIEYKLQGEILRFSLFGRKIKFKKNTE